MTSTLDRLAAELRRIDGKGYGAYKDLRGAWYVCASTGTRVLLDRVQGDPYAAPSRIRVRVPAAAARWDPALHGTPDRARALADHLARRVGALVASRRLDSRTGFGGGGWGGAKGGDVVFDAPGQQVLNRTSVLLVWRGAGGGDDDASGGPPPLSSSGGILSWIELRLGLGLPARGRSVLGQWATELLCGALPALARDALWSDRHDPATVSGHVTSVEDQAALRRSLRDRGLVAFVADGSVLPRASGADDAPMEEEAAVPFRSPPSLRVELPLPSGGTVSGMGVRPGVTLIVGGGFHGKSTLLAAISRGVYDHCPGDGRCRVVADPTACAIRAEDGRYVGRVDVSTFIGDLPGGKSTRTFETRDASGSTSQAAATLEAVEAGARLLLVDEDTAASNFMVRDRRMQRLVPRDQEPIRPFLYQVRSLFEGGPTFGGGVSTVLVVGGSGDWLDAADCVVAMDDYRASDVTDRARAVAAELPTSALQGDDFAGGHASAPEDPSRFAFCPGPARRPRLERFDTAYDGRPGDRAKLFSRSSVAIGSVELDLSALSQLASASQTRGIADAIVHARRSRCADRPTLSVLLDRLEADLDGPGGLDALAPPGDLRNDVARPRRMEMAAALNRLRGLEWEQVPLG